MGEPVYTPAGLPLLSRGVHLDASAGGCFMEYASLLAGERWSDRPRCVHPALAQLARLVNDAAPAPIRQRLVPLIPDVLGTRRKDASVAPTLVLLCWYHHHASSADRRVTVHRDWAQRRLRALAHGGTRARWCRVTDPAYRDGPATSAMAWFVQMIAREGDHLGGERLVDPLTDAIAYTRRVPVDRDSDRDAAGVHQLRTLMRSPAFESEALRRPVAGVAGACRSLVRDEELVVDLAERAAV